MMVLASMHELRGGLEMAVLPVIQIVKKKCSR